MAERLRIAIIEDEPLIASGIAASVEELSHEVAAVFSNGVDALRQIDALNVDLFLVDINLPQVDGITVMQAIHERFPIPCIFITGYSEIELIERAQSIFTFGYLIKPVDTADLRAAINVAIGRFHDFNNMHARMQKAQKSLTDRKTVERAKGIIMNLLGLSEPQAMRYLQKKSRDRNKKLVEIAQEIIDIERGAPS